MTAEHAVIVTYRLPSADEPRFEDALPFATLERAVGAAVAAADVGKLDGHGCGSGTFDLYIYGPDGDRLFAVVLSVLRRYVKTLGAPVVEVRYGSANDENAKRRVVRLDGARA